MSGLHDHEHAPSFTIAVVAIALAATPLIFVLGVAARTAIGLPSDLVARMTAPGPEAVVVVGPLALRAEVLGASAASEAEFVVAGSDGTRTVAATVVGGDASGVYVALLPITHADNGGYRAFVHVVDADTGVTARSSVVRFTVGIEALDDDGVPAFEPPVTIPPVHDITEELPILNGLPMSLLRTAP